MPTLEKEEAYLIDEFHLDHQKVVSTLTELREGISSCYIARMRMLVAATENHAGPQFKFEHVYLDPALERFIGGAYLKGLVNEHDGIFRSERRLTQLAQKESWFEADYQSAMTNLEPIYEHPIGYNGLILWIERMPKQEKWQLLDRM